MLREFADPARKLLVGFPVFIKRHPPSGENPHAGFLAFGHIKPVLHRLEHIVGIPGLYLGDEVGVLVLGLFLEMLGEQAQDSNTILIDVNARPLEPGGYTCRLQRESAPVVAGFFKLFGGKLAAGLGFLKRGLIDSGRRLDRPFMVLPGLPFIAILVSLFAARNISVDSFSHVVTVGFTQLHGTVLPHTLMARHVRGVE